MTGCMGGEPKTNSKGESNCFNCGSPSHWAYKCLWLSGKQQVQLHMSVEAQEEQGDNEQTKEGHQLLNITLAQGGALPDNRAYLNGCSTVTAFKSGEYVKNVKAVQGGIKINCNTGTRVTNLRGTYGGLKVWYLPNGIADIFLMHEIEKFYCITYDSWDGYYVMHTPKGEVRFHKYEQGLPPIHLEESNMVAAMMLLQQEERACQVRKGVLGTKVLLVEMVQGNYEGFTKREVIQAKEVCQGQAMIGNPSKNDYKGMVSNNLITNCPITLSDVT